MERVLSEDVAAAVVNLVAGVTGRGLVKDYQLH